MSLPVTEEEKSRYNLTRAAAGAADNVVSTACPECNTRFAILAWYGRGRFGEEPDWHLRCTVCGARCKGDLKPRKAQI